MPPPHFKHLPACTEDVQRALPLDREDAEAVYLVCAAAHDPLAALVTLNEIAALVVNGYAVVEILGWAAIVMHLEPVYRHA